jgi:hypothetical protein
MKTKALLIAAAALAAGVMTSQAQSPVYSQNVVGYVNIPETAGGFSLEAPPLDLDGTGTNNTLSSLYPHPAVNDSVYVYSPVSATYVTYTYQKKTTGIPPNQTTVTNWYDPSGVVANDSLGVINPGQSLFYNAAVDETNTYVGQVMSGSLTNKYVPVANGFNLVSSLIPMSGGITTTLNYVPSVNDSVYVYSGGQYITYTYQKKTTGIPPNQTTVTNWYNPSGGIEEPVIKVGQGFWLNPASSAEWTQSYTNQ